MKKVVVIVGSGCRGSEKEVKKYLKVSGFDFVTTWGAKDMFPVDYPKYIGSFGITGSKEGNVAVQDSDILIILGSSLNTHHTGSDPSKFAPKAYKIMVDIDEEELNKQKIDLPMHRNIKEVLGDLPLFIS